MKWPETITLIRHDESAYNRHGKNKDRNLVYKEFKDAYDVSPDSDHVLHLAQELRGVLSLGYGDHNTPLAKNAGWKAEKMAARLKEYINLPDIIFVSPYERTLHTLERMKAGWQELNDVRVVEEERIREQDHGLSVLYSDWRLFNVFNPDQRKLRELQGSYWYRYPNGESVPDVRERLRSWTTTLTRDFSSKNVLTVTHHLAILAFRANMERLDEHEFNSLDQNKKTKPINAGATVYRGRSDQGTDGKLVLDFYNRKFY